MSLPDSIKQLYEQTYQFINQINLGDALLPLIDEPSIDKSFIDNFKCLLCNQELSYEPMEFLPIAEVGTCPCKNTFCARAIKEVLPSHKQGVTIRDLVMTFPDHNWSIMIPCHGDQASWGATPNLVIGNSPVAKIVHCSNAKQFPWIIKLDEIPDFFRNSRDLEAILDKLERMNTFA